MKAEIQWEHPISIGHVELIQGNLNTKMVVEIETNTIIDRIGELADQIKSYICIELEGEMEWFKV